MGQYAQSNSNLQDFFIEKTLLYAKPLIVKSQFATKATLPVNKGANKVAFFRFNVADDAEVLTLTEGSNYSVTAGSGTLTETKIEVSMTNYGINVPMTSAAVYFDFFDILQQSAKHCAESVALKVDTLLRNSMAGSATGSAATERYPFGLTTKSFSNLSSTTGNAAALGAVDLLDACTNLRVNKAPVFDERRGYIAVMSPAVTRDIKRDADWLAAHNYANADQIYEGEVGMWGGLTVIEDTNAYLEANNTQYTFNSSGTIYSNLIFGKDAYGMVDMTKESTQPTAAFIGLTADSGNVFQLARSVAMKFWMGQTITNGNFIVNLRSKTNYA